MTFGETLRKLMDLTETKQSQLAAHLGYDVSYISRWTSDIKLPSVKNNAPLFNQIAAYLIKNGGGKNHDAICNAFSIESNLNEHDYIDAVSGILVKTYQNQIGKPQRSIGLKIDNNSMLSQISLSMVENNRTMAAAVAEASLRADVKTLEVFCIPLAEDFGLNECKPFWTNINSAIPTGKTVHVRQVVPLGFKEYSTNICRDIFVFLFGLAERICVDIYSIPSEISSSSYSIWLCKDAVIVLSYYDALLERANALMTRDPKLLAEYYGATDSYLRGQLPLVRRDSFEKLYSERFFQDFLMNSDISSLHTVMPMMYVNQDLLCQLTDKYRFSDQTLGVYSFFEKAAKFWSAVIYKSAVINFFFDGKLYMFGKIVDLSREARIDYLTHLIEVLSRGIGNICIINDVNPQLNRSEIDCSFFVSQKGFFGIRHNEQANLECAKIVHSSHAELIECIDDFLQEMCALDSNFVMNHDESIEFLKQGFSLI